MTETDLQSRFTQLLERQTFNPSKLDYSIMDAHKTLLNKLAEMGNSGVSVFDMYQKKHIFASYSFERIFGYDMELLKTDDIDYFDSKVHPDDLLPLRLNALDMFNFALSAEGDSRLDYKLINEYRVMGANGTYMRVIEQHQVMELCPDGNIWLSLSILDLSPNQDDDKGVKSQLFNFRTGKLIPVTAALGCTNDSGLTKKEKEVLRLVKDGLLSKEISNKLSISIHTVNTHRQRILVKLDADNAMEAVKKASALGLLA
jgi:DNA-binding CsgD family transcriptional regulator